MRNVVNRADRTLYTAENEGRNRCVAWSESQIPVAEKTNVT